MFQNFQCTVRKAFRDNNFNKNLVNFRRRRFVHLTVDRQNAAKDGYRVGFIRFYVCFMNGLAHANTARICVFTSYYARLVKFFYKLQRAVCVVDIVIGKFLTPKLFCFGKRACTNKFFAIIGRALMGIFAIAHILRFFIGESDAVGETNLQFFRQVVGNHAIVNRRMCEYFIL